MKAKNTLFIDLIPIFVFIFASLVVAQNSLDFIPVWVRVGDRTAAVDKERDTASIESAEFSPDGALIASGAKRGGDVRLWNLDGEELWQRFHENEPDDEVEVIAWTRDSEYVLSGGEDFRVRVWRVADGQLVRTLDHIASVDGMRVDVLVDQAQDAGTQQIQVSGRNWPSGIYFYQLDVLNDQQSVSQTRKMMLIK